MDKLGVVKPKFIDRDTLMAHISRNAGERIIDGERWWKITDVVEAMLDAPVVEAVPVDWMRTETMNMEKERGRKCADIRYLMFMWKKKWERTTL